MKEKEVNSLNHWIKTHGDLALDFVRIYLGIALVFKALFFMNHPEYLARMMDSVGGWWFAPRIFVYYIVFAHLFGGICMGMGFFTRSMALVNIPILLGALFYVHAPDLAASVDARQSVELTGLILFLLLVLSVYGAGRLSVDNWLAGKDHEGLYETKHARAT
jgi:putative oxidoreductase